MNRSALNLVIAHLLLGLLTNPVQADYGPLKATLDRFYDGDTVYLYIDIWPTISAKVGLRIAGIQAPEIRAKSQCEKRAGFKAKAHLIDLMGVKKTWMVVNIKRGTWPGRVVGDVLIDGRLLSELMIESGHAIPYDGKGKAPKWVCD